MAELIAKIVLGGSLIGIGTILVRKIPILAEIPEEEIEKLEWKALFFKLWNWLKSFKVFSSNIFLQKVLSKIKVLTSRIERKTEDKLQRLRKEVKDRKDRREDGYWEELKKVKDDNNPPK